jgi:hypothetical protein
MYFHLQGLGSQEETGAGWWLENRDLRQRVGQNRRGQAGNENDRDDHQQTDRPATTRSADNRFPATRLASLMHFIHGA